MSFRPSKLSAELSGGVSTSLANQSQVSALVKVRDTENGGLVIFHLR